MGLFSGIGKAIKSVTKAVSGVLGGGVGDLIGAGLGYLGQSSANQTNQDIANANNATSIELANTQYQRRVKDLAAAGLNPMLAYMGQGGGAGGAAVPNLQQARVENTASSANQGALTQAQLRMLDAQTEQYHSQAMLNSASAAKVQSETTGSDLSNQERIYLRDKFGSYESKGKQLDAETAIKVYDRFRASNENNTINYLNDFAVKNGFRNFETAVRSSEFRRLLSTNALLSNEIPRSIAEAEFYRGSFGKYVSPYLNSAKTIGQTAAGAALLAK